MRPFPQGELYRGFFRGLSEPCVGVAIRDARPINPEWHVPEAATTFAGLFDPEAQPRTLALGFGLTMNSPQQKVTSNGC